VLKYETSFERKGNGVETVILMKEEDGAWIVSRYTVVPGWRSIQQNRLLTLVRSRTYIVGLMLGRWPHKVTGGQGSKGPDLPS